MTRVLIATVFAFFITPAWSGTDQGCVDACVSNGMSYFHCHSACSWPASGSQNEANLDTLLPVVQADSPVSPQFTVLQHHPLEVKILEQLLRCMQDHPGNFADDCGY
jgi:hypothetical protein